MSHDVVVVPAHEVAELIKEVLCANGTNAEHARAQAGQLLEGDLRDQHSHGLQRLSVLVGRIESGMIRCSSQPSSTWVSESVLVVDGDRGMGPAVAHSAITELMARARETGIAMAAINNTNHMGMLAPYVERMAEAGMVGLALTTSEALVHPWNGSEAMVGTNPIAAAVPAGPRGTEPLVLDMSTSAVSMGRIISHAERKQPIPPGWAVDATGSQTTDATEALTGALSPFGGPKGYALGITLEALVATLTSSSFGRDVKGTLDTGSLCTKGDLFIAISIERLGLAGMTPRLTEYLQAVRDSARSDDGQPIYVPGERARACRKHRMEHGVELDANVWERAVALRDDARRKHDRDE